MSRVRTRFVGMLAAGRIRFHTFPARKLAIPSSSPRPARPLTAFLTCPHCRADRVQIDFIPHYRWNYTRWCPDCNWCSPDPEHCSSEELELIDQVLESRRRTLHREADRLANPGLELLEDAIPAQH